jgi:hypothetical protein
LRAGLLRAFRVALLLLLASPPCNAREEASRDCPAIDTPAPVSGAALRAFVDPETGRLRAPTPEESRRLAEAASAFLATHRGRVYTVVIHPNGMKTVELDDAFDMSVVAVRQPDGSVRFRCVSGAAAAEAAR